MIFGIFYISLIMVLSIYMNYFLNNRNHYVENVVKILRVLIVLMHWVFYLPFFEVFITIFNC